MADQLLTTGQEDRMTWKPISSAPRDGAEILAWDGAGMAVVKWKPWNNGGYFALVYNGPYAEDDYFDGATHWMPLPEPPKETE